MIDTHQHLIEPDHFHYGWAEGVAALQGAFRVEDYAEAAQGCAIEGTLFMEVDVDPEQSAAEARFFCERSENPGTGILGVIAGGRPENEGFEATLDAVAHPRLVGIRRVLHTQPDALSQGSRFRENLRRLGGRGLSFDLCVRQDQLGLALELVRACPGTTFIIDHCGSPDIAAHDGVGDEGFSHWRSGMEALAAVPGVYAKISGISVYARADQHTAEVLNPYIETVVESFTPSRCLWGGDWPVVNLGMGLSAWCELSRACIEGAAGEEAQRIFVDNARGLWSSLR